MDELQLALEVDVEVAIVLPRGLGTAHQMVLSTEEGGDDGR